MTRSLADWLRALCGLFSDDGRLAVGLIVWAALAARLGPLLGLADIGGLLKARRRVSRPAKYR
jgi:hypothetical protein